MGLLIRPEVKVLEDGGRIWQHRYNNFELVCYVPVNNLDGAINNYSFCTPLLIVLEDNKMCEEETIKFAHETGLAEIAAKKDGSVLFVYPTDANGWASSDESLYIELIGEIKLNPFYKDGIVEDKNLFTQEFIGYFIRGAKFRTYIYSYGKSADYAAKHLLKAIEGEYLWGPGDISPAMVSMEGLSVIPQISRNDIPIISVGNSDETNSALSACEHLLVKKEAEYENDYYSFVRKYKMWCGQIAIEQSLDDINMVEEPGKITVKTSPDNFGIYKDTVEHEIGYFAYYNKNIFADGPAPLVIGFHGAGDSSMFLSYVSGWYQVAHKYGFLFVSFENHQDIPADEVMQALEVIKQRYSVDEHRIYAVGFSMGCGKTWDLFEQYPSHFAGIAPASALFPVYSNPFGRPVLVERINKTNPLPIFYSGGEKSHVSELPFQSNWAVERLKYAMEVNRCIKKFDFTFEDQGNWDDPMMAVKGDRVERIHDDDRDSYINVHYFDSEDGVCRTVFAAVEGQGHEYRQHTAELAWQFISQFKK